MIDGIKIELLEKGMFSKLKKEPIIKENDHNFAIKVSEQTGEILPSNKTAKSDCLNFTCTKEEHLYIDGSLRKFFFSTEQYVTKPNKPKTDILQYNFNDVYTAVKRIEDRYNISNLNAIRKIETSFIIDTQKEFNLSPREVLNSVLFYNTDEARVTYLKDKRAYGIEFTEQRYKIKVYDKGLQSEIESNITNPYLNIEVSFNKMIHIKETGIEKLQDLTNIEKLKKLFVLYYKIIGNMVIYKQDSITLNKLKTSKERDLIRDFRNPKYWQQLDKRKRYKNKQKFQSLIDTFAKTDVKKDLQNCLKKRFLEFLNIDKKTILKILENTPENVQSLNNENTYNFTGNETFTAKPAVSKWDFLTTLGKSPFKKSRKSKSLNTGNLYNSTDNEVDNKKPAVSKGDFLTYNCKVKKSHPPKKKYCKVCSKDISSQRPNSMYCTDTRICKDKAWTAKRKKIKINKRIEEDIRQDNDIIFLCSESATNKIINITNTKGKEQNRGIFNLSSTEIKNTSSLTIKHKKKEYYLTGAKAKYFITEYQKTHSIKVSRK